ncbi:MAG: glycosyltransferase family 39 protein [Bacteroidia bacterium]|nr:glycosyltransferase family 39 protein [Bacteroidia bacterium]
MRNREERGRQELNLNRRINLIILSLSLFGVLIHLGFYQNLGFHRDELLYFSLGEHPDFGYFSVPPLIGFLAAILTKLFGYTLFAAKILPALLGGVVIYLCARLAKELKGGFFAQIVAAVGIICSIIFLRAFSLFQPVFLDIFFWTLSLYLLLRYHNSNLKKYLYLFGLTIGIGILNKYNLLFLVIAVLGILPFTKHRKLFLNRDFYLTILLAFLIVLPNIIWQITHEFPVLSHLAQLQNSQLTKMSSATFLIEQLLMNYPATLLVLPGLLFLLFNKRVKEYHWLGYVMVLVLLLYLILQGKSYYSAGIYPTLVAAGAVFFERYIRNYVLRSIIVSVLLLLTWSALPMGIASKSPEKLVVYFDEMAKVTKNDAVRRYENNKYYPLPQDYADMLGWDELTEITNKAWQLAEPKEQCIIYAENYGQAGAITILGKKYHLPEAISFSDNFRYRIPKTFDREITGFIYINGELGKDIEALFQDIQEVGRVSNPLAREFGTRVYLCRKPLYSFNKFWESRISK